MTLTDQVPKGEYVCYCLQSDKKPWCTYFGSTNNLKRRIRQHNGEITGGAKSTHANRPWHIWYIVRGFGENKKAALRYEWFCKFKHNRNWLKNKKGCSHKVKRVLLTFKAFKHMDDSFNLKVYSDNPTTELVFSNGKLKN